MTPLAFVEKHSPPKAAPKPPYLLYGEETQLLEEMRVAVRRPFPRDNIERAAADELPASPLLHERGKGLFGGGAPTLVEIIAHVPPARAEQEALATLFAKGGDDVLLVVLHGLEYRHIKTAWFDKLAKQATAVRAERLGAAAAGQWIRRWAAEFGAQLDEDAAALLAAQTEGNLAPAKQAIIKLSLAAGESGEKDSPADTAAVRAALADGAKYDLFDLTDNILAGQGSRSVSILRQLRAAGVADPLLVWGTANIVLQLAQMQAGKMPRVRRDVLDSLRQLARAAPPPVLQKLLRQAAYADRVCKGVADGDNETALVQIAINLAALRRGVKITLPTYPL